jgi:hypothetical protein
MLPNKIARILGFSAIVLMLIIGAFSANTSRNLEFLSANLIAQAGGSFSSDCKMVATQPGEFEWHIELVHKNTNQRDPLCRVLNYYITNHSGNADITGMTEYSLDVTTQNSNVFNVYVGNGGQEITKHFVLPVTSTPGVNPYITNTQNSSSPTLKIGDHINFMANPEGAYFDAEWEYDKSILDCNYALLTLFCDAIGSGSTSVRVKLITNQTDRLSASWSPAVVALVQPAASFGETCKMVLTQPSEFLWHVELVNKNTNARDALCRVVTHRVENYRGDAFISAMSEYSLDITTQNNNSFTIYIEKDGEVINQPLDLPITSGINTPTPTPTPATAIDTLAQQKAKARCNVLGGSSYKAISQLYGVEHIYCRFSDGECTQNELNDRACYKEKDKKTTAPTTSVPGAGYEQEVRVNYTPADNPFPDTSVTDLTGIAAAELYRRNVIGGFPDGEFKEDRDVTRAGAAKFLLLARGYTIGNLLNNGRFWDVIEGEWYVRYIMEAVNRGIMKGHPDGRAAPGDGVQKDEFMALLARTFDLPLGLQHTYSDVPSSAWAYTYVGIADKYQLFPGASNTRFNPSHKTTRGEVAIAIYQYLKNR